MKKGYSAPESILEQVDKVHGKSSFHKQDYTEMKDIIQNTHFKNILKEKVKSDVMTDLIQTKLNSIQPKQANRASELRKLSAI